jgi:O-antigen/teichoic acid export membrane protein
LSLHHSRVRAHLERRFGTALQLADRVRGALAGAVLTGAAQIGIQLLGFVTGLVVIRALPIGEYALYTLAMAALGTATVLADCGVSQAVLSSGGKIWQRRDALGGVINGGRALRRPFAWMAAVASALLLYGLLREQGASITQASLILIAVIPGFVGSLVGQLYEIVPRLHQRIAPLQRIQLSGAGLRLGAVTAAVLLLPSAWIATVTAGLAQLWIARRTRRFALGLIEPRTECDARTRVEMASMVRRTAPTAVYYAFSGQLSVWLISVFGEAASVAQVGALGRLAMVFNVLTTVFSLLIAPRFARMDADGRRAWRWFWFVQGAMVLPLIALVLLVARFPYAALAILGDSYGALGNEVVLVAASGAVALLGGCASGLAAARGVVAAPTLVIGVALVLHIVLIAILPISTVAGVLWMSLITNAAFWLLHVLAFRRVALR